MRPPARIPSFEEVVDVIVEVHGVDRRRVLSGSRLESDLGITGDDGTDMLEALAEAFGTDFDRPDHNGVYLFHSEGWSFWGERVIPITVGDLYLAVLRGRWEDPPWHEQTL